MFRLAMTFVFAIALILNVQAGEVRTWTDATGKYTIEATLIAFDDDQVIIERAEDNELASVDIEKLSTADQEYLESKEAIDEANELNGAVQKWTLKSGLQVAGRLVDYGRKEVVIRRTRGKVYVNDRVLGNLPPIYQRMVPLIVGNAGNKVDDERTLVKWLASRKGEPQTFEVDGVILELENGDEYGVPFFMLSEEDLAVLQPGWDHWLANHEDIEAQQDQAFMLQTEAARYQQQQQEQQQSQRRIAQLQLGLQAVEAGVTSVWEVTLYPNRGNPSPPQWVTVFARDSRAAAQQAVDQNPGFSVGPIRRVSR